MSQLVLAGDTSGTITIAAPAVAGSATYTLPSADGSSGQLLSTNGAGTLSWATGALAGGLGFRNRIINGGFTLNQRGYVTNTSLSSGSYGHDRWKGGSGAGTYTFTQGSTGVNTTITITTGTLMQVIEGCNLPEGGTYVLSWTGTAQGRLNSGIYGASGSVTVTGWTAGTNLNVEFNTGTLGSVQLEKGSTATAFDYRPYGTELALCQRYYQSNRIVWSGQTTGAGQAFYAYSTFKMAMRAAPTGTISGESLATMNAGSLTNSATDSIRYDITASGTNSQAYAFATIIVSAEL